MSRPALVAPDSFKGSFDSAQVAAAIARGLRAGGREAIELPIADGGEGTLDVLVGALGGDVCHETVHDPLDRSVRAGYALLDNGVTAVVEAAQASGLELVAESERDPMAASTRGTGELIAAAAAAGAETVLVTVGGSATTDGGAGALAALEDSGLHPRLTVLCDVRTAWEDAARTFGPQKGAGDEDVLRLERRLERLAARAPRDPRGVPMTGAAGGLAGGLWAHRGAKLVPGAPFVLDAVDFDSRMRESSFAVTGEGSLDSQTLQGKAAGEVATRCRQAGVACHAIVGRNCLDPFDTRILDLSTVAEATTLAAIEGCGRALA